ncbi:MAG TPA: PilN domain-containing protein [Solirubrobacterales bacterium]|jgi:Tfp pilus assembly protein PilN|nr:PilN domain-containing protein [Solirubrobacterales bacterium]
MRPVNLIPPEQRRGTAAPTRTGSLVYVVIGALALILVGVTAMVVFGKKVDDKKTEVATLEVKAAETSARAESLATYTTFQSIHDARIATVSQLATSRFDWQRVLEELSRVLPQHIWLTNLTGTVTPDVQVEDAGAEDGGLRDSIPGPALVLAGCGRSHNDVARLVAAMKDIDGITRVTAADSSKSDSSSGSSTGSCQTKPSIPQFHLVAAFDGVAVPGAAPDTSSTTTSTTTETTTSTESDGGVSQVEAQNQQARNEVDQADAKTDRATNLLPSGG